MNPCAYYTGRPAVGGFVMPDLRDFWPLLPNTAELRRFSRDVLRRERRETIENCLALLKRIGERR